MVLVHQLHLAIKIVYFAKIYLIKLVIHIFTAQAAKHQKEHLQLIYIKIVKN